MERMLKNAENGPSSTNNKRVESLKALQERGGKTAPGSEIPLTGEGLLGGSSSSRSKGNTIENMTNELRKDPKFDAEIKKQARELQEKEQEQQLKRQEKIQKEQEKERKRQEKKSGEVTKK
jgi:hypothetical protein